MALSTYLAPYKAAAAALGMSEEAYFAQEVLKYIGGGASTVVDAVRAAANTASDTAVVAQIDAVKLAGTVVNQMATGPASPYAGTGSFQAVAPDLNLDPAAGSADGSNPKFIAAMMGNLIGAMLTKDANYLAGVIGAFSVTGTKATTYPAGGVLAQISDGVTEADGAVVAYVDGDSAVTKANAAFKAMSNNSNAGSGFDYGLDLTSPAHDGYNDLAILKSDIRMSSDVCMFSGATAPVDGTTGAGFAGPGSLYIARDTGKGYLNSGSKATPAWKIITSA